MIPVQSVVEGDVDLAVIERLISTAGGTPGTSYGRHGKEWIRLRIGGFVNAAQFSPWVILVDLNHEAECVPPALASWVPPPAPPLLCFRMAVREVESWLMADSETLAEFLSVHLNRVPIDPEAVDQPKEAMVDLASHSRRRDIREDMCPRAGSGRSTGPAYGSRLIQYASSTWRPDVAMSSSDSLWRAHQCLSQLATDYGRQLSGETVS